MESLIWLSIGINLAAGVYALGRRSAAGIVLHFGMVGVCLLWLARGLE